MPDDAVPPLSVRLFGPFEVRVSGQPLPHLSFRKSQSVLALLALRPGREAERDWLAGLLWPDRSQASALHSLRNCLTDLRRALRAEAGRLRSPTPHTLTLELAGSFVDVLAFDVALARDEPGSLEEALSLYRGSLLEGCTEAWVFQERQAREQTYLAARETLAAHARAGGDAAAAERHLRAAVAADPLRESAQRSLMELLAAEGSYAAALMAYRELRLRLHGELNAEPDPETQSLFRRLQTEARQRPERPSSRLRSVSTPTPGSTPQIVRPLRRARAIPGSSSPAAPTIADALSNPFPGALRLPAREGVETLSVPESVQALILSRFDRLRPELKRLLQSAAVIGPVFRLRVLEQVNGKASADQVSQGGPDLTRLMRELEDQGLVYAVRAAPEYDYSFKHVLMQETIYRGIPRRHRTVFHQRVATAIEALSLDGLDEQYEQLAYHYERTEADEKAIEYLLKAGEKAQSAYQNEVAISAFRRALDRLDDTRASLRHPRSRMEGRLKALRGLGESYQGIGKHAEAEEQFRQAIELGQRMELGIQELARLYSWLGESLVWQRRAAEMVEPAEEMLALLGENTETVEAALMNEMAGMGYRWRGNREKAHECIRRNTRFLQRLPYSEELRSAYASVLLLFSHEEDNLEEAMRWAQDYEERAQEHRDWRALGGVHEFRSGLLQVRGDIQGAVAALRRALEPYRKTGGVQHEYLCYMRLARDSLSLGDLANAERYAIKQRQAAEVMANKREIAVAWAATGKVLLSQGCWDEAATAFQRTAQMGLDDRDRRMREWAAYALGRSSLARGKREEARDWFQQAACAIEPDFFHLLDVLSGLEDACDDPEAFLAFCWSYRVRHPETRDLPFVQWHLERADPDSGFWNLDSGLPADPHQIRDAESKTRDVDWMWHDPFGDCSFTLRNGMEIRAANGRDLWHPNRSAPRLLRSIVGDFAIQVVGGSVSEGTPAIGGLLLWRGTDQYVRLDWGSRGPHQISFGGCLPGKQLPDQVRWGWQDVIVGRGRLPAHRVVLRLERCGGSVRALCSTDGRCWFTVGRVEFPGEDPLEVGVYAVGAIDRWIYPGAHPQGTAIRFESLELRA